jgi:hypothetical protein
MKLLCGSLFPYCKHIRWGCYNFQVATLYGPGGGLFAAFSGFFFNGNSGKAHGEEYQYQVKCLFHGNTFKVFQAQICPGQVRKSTGWCVNCKKAGMNGAQTHGALQLQEIMENNLSL